MVTGSDPGICHALYNSRSPALQPAGGAVSSAVERFVYTEVVGGSIPSLPTLIPHTVNVDYPFERVV